MSSVNKMQVIIRSNHTKSNSLQYLNQGKERNEDRGQDDGDMEVSEIPEQLFKVNYSKSFTLALSRPTVSK